MNDRRVLTAAALLLSTLTSVHAQSDYGFHQKALERVNDAGRIGPVRIDGAFGDRYSGYNGTVMFSNVDISVPGNAALPVELRRTYAIQDRREVQGAPRGLGYLGGFGEWDIDVPHLKGTFAADVGWAVDGATPNQRCSVTSAPKDRAVFPAADYWDGYHLHVPDEVDEPLLMQPDAAIPTPGTSTPFPWITKSFWRIACKPATANGYPGEGFIATAPDGTRYTLDHVVSVPAASAKSGWTNGNAAKLTRVAVNFLVTRIEDRHGNWVAYAWSGARLQGITSSDQRAITPVYNAQEQITSATSSVGTWQYAYTGGRLTTVTLPDASTWSYTNTGMLTIHTEDMEPIQDWVADCPHPLADWNGAFTYSVTRPSSAKAVFTFEPRRHFRTAVPMHCAKPDQYYEYLLVPNYSLVFSLASKVISGPALPTMTWTYGYGEAAQFFAAECTPLLCPATKANTITGPDNTWARYHYGVLYGENEGQLLKEEFGSGPGNILRTVTHTHVLASEVDAYPFPDSMGTNPLGFSDALATRLQRPRKATVTQQQGTTFTWRATAFDVFARPTTMTRASDASGSTPRTETIQYHDHLASWTLGQLAKRSVGNDITEEVAYHASSALPHRIKRFGVTRYTLAYRADGTVDTVTDGSDHTTAFDDWYRGIPRIVTFADASTQKAEVSGAGLVTKHIDRMGHATGYTYDPMGRLTGVAHPTDDSVNWTETAQAFERIVAADPSLNLPGGHWRQTTSIGQARRVHYLDALWRPILTREYDNANIAATDRYRRFAYDHTGRTTFTSYARASHDPTAGQWSAYDALGRMTSHTQDSEHGALVTLTDYLSGFKVRTTAPGGAITTAEHIAWDTPAYDWPSSISHAEGATTTIARNIHGHPITLTRSGTHGGALLTQTRHYVYDEQQRLCKTIEPESGATVLAYDAADNIAWRATGLALPSASACNNTGTTDVPLAQRSIHTHDANHRLVAVDHPAGAADVAYTYDADGALRTAATSAVDGAPASVWTYSYNKRRMLTAETLVFDNRSFPITYAYNANGARDSLTTPGGLALAFAPNALGEATAVGTYATNVTRQPSSAVAAFAYGNQVTRTITPTARQWPGRILDKKGNTPLLDHTLTYDVRGNITRLEDGLPGGLETRTLGYDLLDRLTSITMAPTGNETYFYDPLDNVRKTVRAGVDLRHHYDGNHRLARIDTPADETRVAYTWNARGTLASRMRPIAPGQLPPTVIHRDGFESKPAMATLAMVFDAAGRLVSADGGAERYAYDAHGHRIRTSRDGNTASRTQIYTSTGQLLYEEDTLQATATDYIHLDGQLVAKRQRPLGGGIATTTYLHSDHRGTPASESDTAGTMTRRQRLDPYGVPYDGQYRDGPGFTGHVSDETTQLTYMQQRYYDPEAMRFISPDPIAAGPTSFNRYRYAANNPYRFVDPDGRSEKVTGSNIPGNSVAIARMATVAAVPQTLHSGMVQHGGPPIDADEASRQTDKLVSDGNKAGVTMQLSGDGRAIAAFNKIRTIQIDASDWNQASMHGLTFKDSTVAYVFYGAGNITFNAARYMSRAAYARVGFFIHEALHMDEKHEGMRIEQLNTGCATGGVWGCTYEHNVDAHKAEIMRHYSQGAADK